MSDENEAVKGQELEQPSEVENTEEPSEPVETQSDGDVEASEAESDEDELVITLGGESPPSAEPSEADTKLVRHLRKLARETQRENRELQKQLDAAAKASAPKTIEVGPEPTLWDEEIDHDPAKYQEAYKAWLARKDEADKREAEQIAKKTAIEQAFQKKVNNYGTAREQFRKRVRDYDEAEKETDALLSETQRTVLYEIGSKDMPLLVYGLGRHPERAKELAAIESPVEFAYQLARFEAEMKVTTRKRNAPKPEKKLEISTVTGLSSDETLEKLRDEAAQTGNYSKVVAYRRQMRERGG